MRPNSLVLIFWLIFCAYWLLSAIGNKQYVPGSRRRGSIIRIFLIITLFVLFQIPSVRKSILFHRTTFHPAITLTGVLLCAAGIAFAIWARIYLGRNWGVPMSLRKGHELVTTGPYRLVRHPIYTGILLATLGSSLAAGLWWSIAFLVFCVYFTYSAATEEKMMMREFPDQYAKYKKRTRGMIVPF